MKILTVYEADRLLYGKPDQEDVSALFQLTDGEYNAGEVRAIIANHAGSELLYLADDGELSVQVDASKGYKISSMSRG
ncbi:MAG TPA: hypothetical protein VFA76_01940 [Terriglobales bacterium]|nr:hypothetical protein [Terriglobales bacterium]